MLTLYGETDGERETMAARCVKPFRARGVADNST
jgi:hypothetical protein